MQKLFPSRLEIAWAFGWCPKKQFCRSWGRRFWSSWSWIRNLDVPRSSFLRWIILIDDTFSLLRQYDFSSIDFSRRGEGSVSLENEELERWQTVGCFKCISSRASFPPGKFRCWPWLSLFVKRRYSRCTSWTARPGWTLTLGQRVQLAPCGTLIPRMMGDGGGLHHLYLRLHVVLDADEVRCRDLGSMVWDLHGWHMRDLNVQGLGVWGWNSRLLRNLEHLVDFRSVYLRNFSPR